MRHSIISLTVLALTWGGCGTQKKIIEKTEPAPQTQMPINQTPPYLPDLSNTGNYPSTTQPTTGSGSSTTETPVGSTDNTDTNTGTAGTDTTTGTGATPIPQDPYATGTGYSTVDPYGTPYNPVATIPVDGNFGGIYTPVDPQSRIYFDGLNNQLRGFGRIYADNRVVCGQPYLWPRYAQYRAFLNYAQSFQYVRLDNGVWNAANYNLFRANIDRTLRWINYDLYNMAIQTLRVTAQYDSPALRNLRANIQQAIRVRDHAGVARLNDQLLDAVRVMTTNPGPFPPRPGNGYPRDYRDDRDHNNHGDRNDRDNRGRDGRNDRDDRDNRGDRNDRNNRDDRNECVRGPNGECLARRYEPTN